MIENKNLTTKLFGCLYNQSFFFIKGSAFDPEPETQVFAIFTLRVTLRSIQNRKYKSSTLFLASFLSCIIFKNNFPIVALGCFVPSDIIMYVLRRQLSLI